jgi:hypothetical protein
VSNVILGLQVAILALLATFQKPSSWIRDCSAPESYHRRC